MVIMKPNFKSLKDKTIRYQGVTGLWLRILVLSIIELNSQFPEQAEHFIFDEKNAFFEGLCVHLDCEPSALREGIRKKLEGHTVVKGEN